MTANGGSVEPPLAYRVAVDAGLPPAHPVELPGRGTSYVRDIPGPPGAPVVVLLHGLMATADLNWISAYTELAQHFRVIALDQRGHGRGIRPQGRFHLEDCADDVAALADALDVQNFVPVGYSMGGPVAQLVWRRHPHRVAGLVLCATSTNFRPPRAVFAFEAMTVANLFVRITPPALRWHIAERMIARRARSSEWMQWAWSEFRRSDLVKLIEAAQALVRYSADDWIGEVDVPTAVIMTTEDRLVPPSWQQKLAAGVPGARVYEIDADHPVGVREPERFVPVLLGACMEVSSRT
ncbi:MAG TPA: alpha/beta hydrolase [Acidimicrobiales bacterium]|nr:alpha/beta hydrolase [Acidimicrobiales bacterium]